MVDYSNIPRDSRRVPLETRVQFKFDRFSGFLSDFSANISPGGMFIRTRTPQPPGTVLEFEFRLGDGFELIKGRGEVVWLRAEDEGPSRPAGMGLRFLELGLGSKELIYRIVDHHIQQGGTPFDVTQQPPDPVPIPPPQPPQPAQPPQPIAAPPRPRPVPPPPASPAAGAFDLGPAPQAPQPTPLSPLRFDLSPTPAAPPPQAARRGPEPAPPIAAAAWLPPLEEEPCGFDPSPYAAVGRDDWAKAREALSQEPAAGDAPVPAEDHPAAPLFASTLANEPPPRPRRPLPWIVLAVLVVLAGGAYFFRDTLFGLVGLGDDDIAQVTPPAHRPRSGRLRTPVLPTISPAASPGASAATPAASPAAASAPPSVASTPAAGPVTEVSPVRPGKPAAASLTPAPAPTPKPSPPPVVVAQTPPASPKPGAKPPAEKPAPVPAVREDSGPAVTGVGKITFEKAFGGTDVILWGNGAFRSGSYVRSHIDGNPPRELIRISGIKGAAPAARVAVGTPEVLQVRTGIHPGNELHVVLDLAGPKVAVTRVEEGENRLRIHLQKQ
ncbi:MAG TPA: TIGR02266 family protein [Thermoanaerobaculia bacterium]|nr:TIGR02266 family protein [Thermoanaerobaculia bacterium]